MYRDNKPIITDDRMNFVINHGALGDMICSLPAMIYGRQSYGPDIKITVWAPPWQLELIERLLKPYGEFTIRTILDFPLKKVEREGSDIGPVAKNSISFNTYTRNRAHMVDYAFNCLLDATPRNMLDRSYPTKGLITRSYDFSDYVVFPVGATSDNKLFKAHVMGSVMEWCLSRGHTPVLVGTKTSHTAVEFQGEMRPVVLRDEVDKLAPGLLEQCIDMREQTTLVGLRNLLGHAKAVVGVDGGTIHLAGTTHAPIVYAMTTTLPQHRYIAREGDPHLNIRYVGPRDLECTGCQSNWVMTRLDFTKCPYNDNKCTDLLHPDDFINALKELEL